MTVSFSARVALGSAVLAALSLQSIFSPPARADGGRGSDSATLGFFGGAGGIGWLGDPGQPGGNAGSGFGPGGGGGAAGGGQGGAGGGPNGGAGGFGGTAQSPNGGFGGFGGGSNGGGGGGGGGWNGNGSGILAMNNTATLQGGRGGPGGDAPGSFASGGGGGGGGGGYGAVVNGVGTQSNSSSIIGGQGGDGGRGSIQSGLRGECGDGGVGVMFTVPGAIFVNSGYVEGGASGEQGIIPPDSGGVGIVGGDLTIINSGTILGGRVGILLDFVPAITFTSGTNTLELRQGSNIVHDAIAFSAADSLVLGGTANSSLDVSQIGPTAKYRGFGVYRKTGSSTWALSGSTSAVSSWSVEAGVLSAASSGAFGTATLSVASGATWGVQDNVTVSNAGTIGGGGASGRNGAIDNLSGNNTISGAITLDADATIASSSGILEVSGPISIGSNQLRLHTALGGTITISNAGISGTGGVIKSGISQLVLAAPAGFTGGLRIDSSVVRIGHPMALLNNVVTLGSGGGVPRLRLDGNSAAIAGLAEGGSLSYVDNNSTVTSGLLTLDVASGSQTYAGQMLDGSIANTMPLAVDKAGAGSQVLTGNLTYSGATTVHAGELRLANDGAVSAWAPVLNNGGGADIRGGRLVFAYSGSATSPQATIVPLLDGGFDVNFASGRFRSSTAVVGQLGLGWGDDPSTGRFTVAYTRYGDANLDGTTNIGDFSILASHFNLPGGWPDGDMNYDGSVTIGDFSLLASNFNTSVAAGARYVPEPGFMSGVSIVVFATVYRRRRMISRSDNRPATARPATPTE